MKRAGGIILFCWLNVTMGQCQFFKPKPLRPAHGEIAPTFWEQHAWQVVVACALFFALVGLLIFLLRRPRHVDPEPPAAIACRTLKAWKNRPEDGQLVSDVSRVLRRYIISAFGFAGEELTTTEFRQSLLRHPQIPPPLASATDEFLRRCDEWKFAPAPATPPIPLASVVVALDLIQKLESRRAEISRAEIALKSNQ